MLLSGFSVATLRGEPRETTASQCLFGMAWMRPDGTIILDLHGGAEVNHALAVIEYPPSHKDYAAVPEHLGGLAPGQRKPVPAWPDQP